VPRAAELWMGHAQPMAGLFVSLMAGLFATQSAIGGPDRDVATWHAHDQNPIVLAQPPGFDVLAC
jgi:hypothetical protein